ncbi:hypothetical protein CGCFRS4_v013465 [Colletotrichum fructicola]|nr:hypothetical protein CGCFRS4_v013465 [Colletotrichum fructicola]KAF4927888.1 hypothetical protein CGCF245_v012911 [Colletotrichum fructicola]
MNLEGITWENPVMISEDHDDAESANTQAPNQDEERRDDNDYTALVLLVRDGCYGKQQPPYCESSHAQHHCISANRAICHANVAGVSNNAISEGRHEVPSSIAASMCSGASP